MRNKPDSFDSRWDEGIDKIEVKLWSKTDAREAADVVASFYESTWGDPVPADGWLTEDSWKIAQEVAAGRGLPNALESVALTFSFSGISRATTHQLVRTRVGAGFGQQGGRDNDWSEFNFRSPATFGQHLEGQQILFLQDLMTHLSSMYAEALERGVPPQDARYILPMGLETALVGTYNLLSLKGTLQRRLCNRMMWETNYVARLMADLTVLELPWVGKNLRASCQRGICQSVSPMFPPADLVPYSGSGDARYVSDNSILQKMVEESGYDWTEASNGCAIHFDEIDRKRIEMEHIYPGTVYSLVDGVTRLAIKKDELWKKAR